MQEISKWVKGSATDRPDMEPSHIDKCALGVGYFSIRMYL